MDMEIKATDNEKLAVLRAIKELNEIQHLKYMSQAMLATHSGLKPTKVRIVLTDLIEEGKITQYSTTENKRLQRFYYVINESGAVQ